MFLEYFDNNYFLFLNKLKLTCPNLRYFFCVQFLNFVFNRFMDIFIIRERKKMERKEEEQLNKQ